MFVSHHVKKQIILGKRSKIQTKTDVKVAATETLYTMKLLHKRSETCRRWDMVCSGRMLTNMDEACAHATPLTNSYLWKPLSMSTETRKRTCTMLLWNTKEAHLLQSLLYVKVFLIVKLKHILKDLLFTPPKNG